jgi:2-phospho-L-lactate guanylyltransferase (CobY/MobA/RfbA family)
VTQFVIPFRRGGKTRLGDEGLALAMLRDVTDAINALGAEPLVVDGPGGQGEDVLAALATLRGPVVIVNGDVPCVTPHELGELAAHAPAIVAARDGTTNAISIGEASAFAPLYGPGSAARFAEHLRAEHLALPGLRDDVDTWDDLEHVRERVGMNTRFYLTRLERSQAS